MINREKEEKMDYPGIFAYSDGVIRPFKLDSGLPWRIRNRLLLHEIKACGMFTTILPPDPCCVETSDFREIVKLASTVNEQIGLPGKVNDLVVRTRDALEVTRMAGNNPILRILDVASDNPRFIQIKSHTDPEQEFKDFLSWQESLKVPMFCMIHEDNPALQMKSIHGRVMRLDNSSKTWELSLGTGVLHARTIGEPGTKYVGMWGHELPWLIENVVMGNMMSIQKTSSVYDAIVLARKFDSYQDQLAEVYRAVESKVGKNVVLEFRLYPNSAGLQVYDFDKKF